VQELAFHADRRAAEPMFRQLAAHLRGLIEAGRLAVGEKLPPTRELAAALGLSRATVTQAYLHLGELGLVGGHVGRGTYVTAHDARDVGPSRRRAASADGPRLVPDPPRAREFAWAGLLARRSRDLPASQLLARLGDGRLRPFDFRAGRVDPGTFPARALAHAVRRALERYGPRLAPPGDPLGWPPLRELIAHQLVARGIRCAASDVLVVGGAQQALDLIARVLVDPGDIVVVEEPGYFGARVAFAGCGAHLVGVRVDEEGLRTDDLARLLRARRAKLVYTTPAVQCPTGVRLSAERRHALRQLADVRQVPVVEDDYDCELRGDGPAAVALKAGDDAGQVVYVGTFSKAVAPSLRLGYVVAAPPLLERLGVAHFVGQFQTSPLLQAALEELLRSGVLERHVRRVRRLYAARLRALDAALAATMPEGARWRLPAGGNCLWVTLPSGVDPVALRAAARDEGIAYEAGEAFYVDAVPAPALYLSCATLDVARIVEGAERLGRLVRERAVRGRQEVAR